MSDGNIIWVVQSHRDNVLMAAFENRDKAIDFLKNIPLEIGEYIASDWMQICYRHNGKIMYEIAEVTLIKE